MVFVQRVWWAPLTWLFIPLRLNLNVVLGVQEEANGELKFTHQADHIFWVESLLEINPILTLWLGPAFMKFIRPMAGVPPINSNASSHAFKPDISWCAYPHKDPTGTTYNSKKLSSVRCVQ